MAVFWDVVPRSLTVTHRRFRAAYYLRYQGGEFQMNDILTFNGIEYESQLDIGM